MIGSSRITDQPSCMIRPNSTNFLPSTFILKILCMVCIGLDSTRVGQVCCGGNGNLLHEYFARRILKRDQVECTWQRETYDELSSEQKGMWSEALCTLKPVDMFHDHVQCNVLIISLQFRLRNTLFNCVII
jgi:hypothetical protein